MALMRPGRHRYAQCAYCYEGEIEKEGDHMYRCTHCGYMLLVRGDEPKPLSTGELELTSPQLLDHKWEAQKWMKK